ncbi:MULTISPECIES: fimbrial protein [Methanobacterium]|uniref:Uncharacterized protein n=1 Tax=Methanobacterium bryantii TaxID=2161 RepID=A0A2A2H3E8_METBR|nr:MULTISPECIES: hypothetical protein [Methanobacterium]OEC86683.1 hypothetical protein A9507_09520 [Methanobacterium sp. A39]PAV03961.1 hypothetical protein ASJ80_02795 [Methanobacterium bryantii]
MQKNRKLAASLIILIILGALLLTIYYGTQNQVATGTQVAAATKIAYYNNGTTWVHMNVIYENVTLKNGEVKTFYSNIYIKPKSSVTVDLSNMAGYGNQRLPSGTKINILTWKELVNGTINAPTATLEQTIQGWSTTSNPQPNDRYYIMKYPNLTVYNLPNFMNDNNLYIGDDINKLQMFLDGDYSAHEQILLIVDSDGRVRMIFLEIPELCNVVIIDPFKTTLMKTTT